MKHLHDPDSDMSPRGQTIYLIVTYTLFLAVVAFGLGIIP